MNPKISEFVFPGWVPGNNGPKGLLRMHWTKRKKLKLEFTKLVIATRTRHVHHGTVRLELIRHQYGTPMDYDNLVSTGKLLIDCIKDRGIIIDDRPAVIVERDYTQTRARKAENQMTVIRIIDVPTPE